MSQASQVVQPPASRDAGKTPLYVDLDGTLIAGDLMYESVLLLVRRAPLQLLRVPWWLSKGRARLKAELAMRVTVSVENLPYRQSILEFLRAQKQADRRIILATAADQRCAQRVAEHLGLFDAVLGSDGTINLLAEQKLAAIQKHSGGEGFSYIGDSRKDVVVWSKASQAFVVSGKRGIERHAAAVCTPAGVFAEPTRPLRAAARLLRPAQWAKNILVLAPLALAHQWHDPARVIAAIWAVVCFCLSASSAYVLNDLMDIESDRCHPRKSRRPLAAGNLSIPAGAFIFLLLLGSSLLLAGGLVGAHFLGMICIYFVATTAYSFYFKTRLLLDVILLAGLYTLRIIAGGVAADVEVSPWLLGLSMFLFTSLAFAKRYSELTLRETADGSLSGRNYTVSDLGIIESIGPTCGMMAVLVLALYISSDTVSTFYRHPKVLWLACPVLLYWVTRIWFFAKRRKLVDDPIAFALTDRVSLLAAAGLIILTLLAGPK